MRQHNLLSKVDLNLLVTLKTLLDEMHVTRAAQKMGVTQSAMSRALSRLRNLFDDPLLVHTAQGFVPTPRAIELRPLLEQTLIGIESIIQPVEFHPATAQGEIQIVTTDYGAQLLIPSFLGDFFAQAPQMNLSVQQWNQHVVNDLTLGEVDLALGFIPGDPSGILTKRWQPDHLVCVMNREHPIQPQDFDLDAYIAWPHILITMSGQGKGAVDLFLERQKRYRRIALRIPHFLAALETVASTQMLLTAPNQFIQHFADLNRVKVLELPFPLDSFYPAIYWHERNHYDPAHIWVRQFFFAQIQKLF